MEEKSDLSSLRLLKHKLQHRQKEKKKKMNTISVSSPPEGVTLEIQEDEDKMSLDPSNTLETKEKKASNSPEPSNQGATVDELRPSKATNANAALDLPKQMKNNKLVSKTMIKWTCNLCNRECIPIREESRCLCGHRYKEHPSDPNDRRVKKATTFRPFACTSSKCACKSFCYIVAEGAWILRCRCKHRHTDHDPSKKPHKCQKQSCQCDGFDSPWVCNCDHAWSNHSQRTVTKTFNPLELLQQQFELTDLNNVQRTDLATNPMTL